MFKEASIEGVLKKIRNQGKSFPKIEDFAADLYMKLNSKGDGLLSCEEFSNGLLASKLILTYMELHTLHRRFDPDKKNSIPLEDFCKALTAESSS